MYEIIKLFDHTSPKGMKLLRKDLCHIVDQTKVCLVRIFGPNSKLIWMLGLHAVT